MSLLQENSGVKGLQKKQDMRAVVSGDRKRRVGLLLNGRVERPRLGACGAMGVGTGRGAAEQSAWRMVRGYGRQYNARRRRGGG